MRPKQLRRFIRDYLKNKGRTTHSVLLHAVWQQNTNTPVKRIDRQLKKMLKWGHIALHRTADGGAAFTFSKGDPQHD